MFLPRATALFRHACYGSQATSLPALLPLMALLPRDALAAGPDVGGALLEAVWQGALDPSGSK